MADAVGIDLVFVRLLQMVAAGSLESGDFGISSAIKRRVGTTMLARTHVKHQEFRLVAEGRHCRSLPEPLLPRSRQPQVRCCKVILVASSSHSL